MKCLFYDSCMVLLFQRAYNLNWQAGNMRGIPVYLKKHGQTIRVKSRACREETMTARILFKVEKERVLVPVGEPCPFGCKYCYTRGGEVGLAKIPAEEVLLQFQIFAHSTPFETIQFGYDGDPFARPERGIEMLQALALMHKNVNFSTKALLTGSILEALSDIRRHM